MLVGCPWSKSPRPTLQRGFLWVWNPLPWVWNPLPWVWNPLPWVLNPCYAVQRDSERGTAALLFTSKDYIAWGSSWRLCCHQGCQPASQGTYSILACVGTKENIIYIYTGFLEGNIEIEMALFDIGVSKIYQIVTFTKCIQQMTVAVSILRENF